MGYRYAVTKRAHKDIARLDAVAKRRLKTKLEFYIAQDNPLDFALRLVEATEGSYRFRIGSYRVVFDVDGDVIVILRVQHRREVYRA